MTSPLIPPSIMTCETCTPFGPYSLANPLATALKPNFADANAKKGERALREAVAPVNTIVPDPHAPNLAAASYKTTQTTNTPSLFKKGSCHFSGFTSESVSRIITDEGQFLGHIIDLHK